MMIGKFLYRILLPVMAAVLCCNAALADTAVDGFGANRPKVALVLCGGGAKGAAHIGVIKVLEEAGVPVDMVVGTSIGGLVGGIYAMGYSADEIDAIVSGCDWKYLLSDNTTSRTDASFNQKALDAKYLLKVPFYSLNLGENNAREESPVSKLPAGLISGQNVLNFLNGLSVGYQEPMHFGNLPIPFACVAADISSGKVVVLKEGILPVAMRATMAIPGVFAPVEIDGRVLVDGGVLNNFPVDVAREMGADIVIGVDIQNDSPAPENLKSIPQILSQMFSLMGNESYLRNVEDVDILIKPDVSNYGTYSFNKAAVEQLIVNGYAAAREKYDELADLGRKLNTMALGESAKKAPKATEVVRDTFCFRSVSINGIEKKNEHWLRRLSGLKPGLKLSGNDINKGVSILMGTKAFSSVNYVVLNKGTDDEELVVKVRKGPANVVAVGARYDSEEAAAVLVHLGVGEYNLLGSKLGVTGRLSYNPYGEMEYSYTSKDFPKIGLSYRAGGEDMNIYKSTANQNSLLFIYQRGLLSLSNIYLRNFNFEVGSKWEHYDFNDYQKTNVPDGFKIKELRDRSYMSVYLKAMMDTRDDYYYPVSGMYFDTEGSFYHTDFHKGFKKFGAIGVNVSGVLNISESMALLPALYGRVIIGDMAEVPYLNYVGGSEPGRYLEQQMPFIGVNYANLVMDNAAIIGRMDLRQRIGKNHYVYAMANYLRSNMSFAGIFTDKGAGRWGAGLKYSYDSPIGPLSFNLHWSSFDHRTSAYVSLGHYF